MNLKKLTSNFTVLLAVITCATALTACNSGKEKKCTAYKKIKVGDYKGEYALFTEPGLIPFEILHSLIKRKKQPCVF